jgi:enamine deaminase RidA (YjgF/YER057c/UK114 family)
MSEMKRYDPFDGKLGFALANRVGDIVYVSGMTGIEFSDQQVPDGIEAQARLAYKNIESILSQFGASLADSIEQTIFFVGDHAVANAAYGSVRHEFFGDTPPASTMVGVTQLVDPRYLIEIKVTALIKQT